MMKKNMGTADRIIRTVFSVTILVLYLSGMISGTAAVILGVFALIFTATSVIGFCPLYLPLSINTNRNNSKD